MIIGKSIFAFSVAILLSAMAMAGGQSSSVMRVGLTILSDHAYANNRCDIKAGQWNRDTNELAIPIICDNAEIQYQQGISSMGLGHLSSGITDSGLRVTDKESGMVAHIFPKVTKNEYGLSITMPSDFSRYKLLQPIYVSIAF